MSRVLRVTSTVLVAVTTAPLPTHQLKAQPLFSQISVDKSTNARQRMALNRRYTPSRLPVIKTSFIYALAKNRIVKLSENQTLVLQSRQQPKSLQRKQTDSKQHKSTAKHSSPQPDRDATVKATPTHKTVSRGKSFSSIAKSQSNKGVLLAKYALSLVGKPYRWGGESLAGFDCSGLVQYVYRHYHISVPRTSYAQFTVGEWVTWNQLQPGDLIFFSTDSKGASHVAIYIGNGLMVQSLNPSTGVIVSRLSNAYYRNRFIGARRPW